MKKVLSILMAVCMLLAAWPLAVSAQTLQLQPKSLLVLGDSISAGYGLTEPAKRYGDLLASNLKLENGTYTNKAASGAKSSDLVTALAGMEADVQAADLIAISIGGNDVIGAFVDIAKLQNPQVTDIQSAVMTYAFMNAQQQAALFSSENAQAILASATVGLTQNVAASLSVIKDFNSEARVILLLQYDPLQGVAQYASLDAYLNQAIAQLNQLVESAAQAKGYETLDVYAAFAGNTARYVNIANMDIHPTEAGHAKIAELLAAQVRSSANSHKVRATYKAGEKADTVYSVDVSWGSLEFTYTDQSEGVWNPTTHMYESKTEAGWSCEEGADKVTVTNHSNAAVDAALSYQSAAGYNAITASFAETSGTENDNKLELEAADNTTVANAPTAFAKISLKGALENTTAAKTAIGTVTVTIVDHASAVGGA